MINCNAIVFIKNTNDEDDVSSIGSCASEDSDDFFLCLPSQHREQGQQKDWKSPLPQPSGGTLGTFLSSADDKGSDRDRNKEPFLWSPSCDTPLLSAFTDVLHSSSSSKFCLTPKIPSHDSRMPFFPSSPSEVLQNKKKRSLGSSTPS